MSVAVPVIEGFSDLQLLGRGGFSTVYGATQEDLGRRVAIKVLNLDVTPGVSQRRFERECKVVGILAGVPGIVSVHRSAFTTDGRPCIVMELMEGGSLEQFVRDEGPLEVTDALQLAAVLSKALAAAHDRGVAHRDIKPGNVLLSGDGTVALADFGIAMVQHLVTSTQTVDSISPPYSPPERLMSGEPDEQLSDIYSLGATLFFGLSGHAPFGTAREGGVSGLVHRVMNDPLPTLDRPDVPAAFLSLVAQMLSKRPDERPAAAALVHHRVTEIIDELARAPHEPDPVPAPAPATPARGPEPSAATATTGGSVPEELPPPLPPPIDPGASSIRIPAPPSTGAASAIPIPLPSDDPEPPYHPYQTEGGTWPTAVDYARTIQDPATLLDPRLSQAVLQRDMLGMPVSAAGQSAVVFQLSAEDQSVAVRFFTRAPSEGPARYHALARHLEQRPSPALVPTRWISDAIVIDDIVRPAIWMPWLPGRPLNLVVDDLLDDPVRIQALAEQFVAVVAQMQDAEVAHGDLQNGNLLVDDDLSIRLVDLDGVWVPALTGSPPDETGHRCFQHPGRAQQDWGPWTDTYSGLLIYTSLLAIAADPELWSHHQGENLVLTPADLAAPGATPAWSSMAASPSRTVRELTRLLVEFTRASAPPSGPLAEFLDQHAPVEETTAPRAGAGATSRGRPAAPEPPTPLQVANDGGAWWKGQSDPTPDPEPAGSKPGTSTAAAASGARVAGNAAAATTSDDRSMLARLGNSPVWSSVWCSLVATAVAGGMFWSTSPGLDSSVGLFVPSQAGIGVALAAYLIVSGILHSAWRHVTARAFSAAMAAAARGLLVGAIAAIPTLLICTQLIRSQQGESAPSPVTLGAMILVGGLVGVAAGFVVGPMDRRLAWIAPLIGGALGVAVGFVMAANNASVDDTGLLLMSGAAVGAWAFFFVAVPVLVVVVRVGLSPVSVEVRNGPLTGRTMALVGTTLSIGWADESDLVIRTDPDLAPQAAILGWSGSGVTLLAKVPAEVNGAAASTPVQIDDGDEIRIGSTVVKVAIRKVSGA